MINKGMPLASVSTPSQKALFVSKAKESFVCRRSVNPNFYALVPHEHQKPKDCLCNVRDVWGEILRELSPASNMMF